MTTPIPTRDPARARRHIEGWGLVVCEVVTVAALLASLTSILRSSEGPGPQLRPAGTGPRDAFAACARFVDGGAIPTVAKGRVHIDTWQWAPLADGRFRVRGYADARTLVGEAHRTYYQCDLVQVQAGRWRLDSLAVSAHRPT